MAHAILRGFRESPRRVRMVAEMVRGKPVDQALSILRFQTRKAARMLIKVINSAVANAAENEKVDVDRLILRKIDVDGGPVEKRWLPRSMGRANRLLRRSSHVTVVVSAAGE